MTNMALPSGYQQITTGIQFRGTSSNFNINNFVGYVDTGCNGLTNGPQGEETVNKVSYEVSCRRDKFGDTFMGACSPYATSDDLLSSNLNRVSPRLALYNITSSRTYTSTVIAREVTQYYISSGGVVDSYRLRFVRNGVTLATIVENDGEYIDPINGSVFAYNSSYAGVHISYIPDACFGINYNTDYNLIFNQPGNIDIYLETESGGYINSRLDIPYEQQVGGFGVAAESLFNASGFTIWLKPGNTQVNAYHVNYNSYNTITEGGIQYKVYNILATGANPPTVGYLYSYMNDSYAGMIIGNIDPQFWYSETHSGQKHYYARSFYSTTYFASLLKYNYGTKYMRYWEELHFDLPDNHWSSTTTDKINYKLYSKYNSNSIIEQYIMFGDEKIVDLTNRDLDIVSTQDPYHSKNIQVGAFNYPRNSGITKAAEDAATDYILEIKVWDANDTLISHIIPVLNENTGDIGFYDLVKEELATVVLGSHGEYLSAAGEIAVLHNMPKVYIKIGNNLEEFNSAYIKNGDLIGLSASDVMEVKHI